MSVSPLTKPIFFRKNRVRRVYSGGKLFADFFNDDSVDSFYPEEWICSSTRALNEGSNDESEGLSYTEDGIVFNQLLNNYRSEMLGDSHELGILVKILDSAIRLPVQTHPDKEFSRQYFNSEYGKAESWIILGTRDNACIYFGFKEGVTLKQFEEALEKGDEALTSVLNRLPVKAGDVFFVPAKTVHAIGAGCLILEIQEPTDFTIQPEKNCGVYLLSDNEKFLGLSKEIAMQCFDMSISGAKALAISQRTVACENGVERLITEKDTPCFSVNRFRIENGCKQILTGPAVYVITAGEGKLTCPEYSRLVRQGNYFFAPHCLGDTLIASTDTHLEIVQCLPPRSIS